MTPCTARSGDSQSGDCGRFVGRIGALAVALGVGAAIAGGAGSAAADTGTSSNSSDGSSADSGASTSASTSARTPAPSTADAGYSTPDSDAPAASAPTAAGTATTSRARTDRATSRRAAARSSRATQTSAAADSDPVAKSAATQPDTATDDSTVQTTTLAASSSSHSASPNRASAADTPATPSPAPALLSVLGLARREPGQDATPRIEPTAMLNQVVSTLGVSPLGTSDQLSAEQTAAETLDTLPVLVMSQLLKVGWRIAGNQQFDLVGGPDEENLAQLDNAVREYAMGAAFQQQILNSNNPAAVMQVAPPHTWYGLDVPGSRILYDNPDTIYRFMGVNKASTYTITGRFTENPPTETSFSVLTGLSGNTASVLMGDDLVLNDDGTFTIYVSADPPAPGQDNHLQLTSDSTLIAVRNTLADWNTEDPTSLQIIKTGGPPDSLFSQYGGFAIPGLGPLVVDSPLLTMVVSLIPPLPQPPIVRGTVAALVMTLGFVREPEYIAVATTDPDTGERRQPNVMSAPARNASFLATQLQSAGYFQLEDDQALVVTIDPGDAEYFVVPVTNDWTITTNYWDEPTSLNIAQAKDNGDGTYTLVITPTDYTSPDDKVVRNWVSTGGLNQGTVSIRFQGLPLDPVNMPTVQSEVVSLDELPATLGHDGFITAAERQTLLDARKAGYDKRFAPYPQT